MSYNLERGSGVYVVLLDIKKAFDSAWIDGLMFRLFEISIDLKWWKLINDLYSNAECCVKIGGRLSQWFTFSQGVHQGAPLSMMNDVISSVHESCYQKDEVYENRCRNIKYSSTMAYSI